MLSAPVRPESCWRVEHCSFLFRLCVGDLCLRLSTWGRKETLGVSVNTFSIWEERRKLLLQNIIALCHKTLCCLWCVSWRKIVGELLKCVTLTRPVRKYFSHVGKIGVLWKFVGSYKFHWDKLHTFPLIYWPSRVAPADLETYLRTLISSHIYQD